jgi:hypothetical protein
MGRKQLPHHTCVRWLEVLDQNKRHAVARWHRIEESSEGVETSGGCTERNDRYELWSGIERT